MNARPLPEHAARAIPRGRRALATAGLLFLALLSSSLKLHNDMPHGHDAPENGVLIFADARHPEAPVHLEASSSVALRHCNTCLLQRDQVHGPLSAPTAVVAVTPTTVVFGARAAAPRPQPHSPRSSRGPPVV